MLAEDRGRRAAADYRRFHQLAVERGTADLQSGSPTNLFWLGRYIERLDNDARLLRTTAARVAQGAVGPRDAVELRLARPASRLDQPDGSLLGAGAA